MKKTIIFLLLIILLAGCNSKPEKEKIPPQKEKTENKITEENKYIDNNPIKLSMYIYNQQNNTRILTTEYSTNWTKNIDLCSLEVYYTTDKELPKISQKKLWNNYYSNYQNIDSYRIGYKIEFSINNEKISKTILSPQDTTDIFDYIQIYLYDDINVNSNWYDHIEKDEYTESTLLTSIKLTGSNKTNLITSDIYVTAFTYDSDDFDESNEYKGISYFTTTIKKN